jgi:hypothetical protein
MNMILKIAKAMKNERVPALVEDLKLGVTILMVTPFIFI